MLVSDLKNSLFNLSKTINKLTDKEYTQPIKSLSYSTIGSHVRHILEFVQCLSEQYDADTVNYDLRKRDKDIETSSETACKTIETIISRLQPKDKKLRVVFTNYNGGVSHCETTFFREIMYNIEHCIHHEALIKVALMEIGKLDCLDSNFGVAPSTIKNRQSAI